LASILREGGGSGAEPACQDLHPRVRGLADGRDRVQAVLTVEPIAEEDGMDGMEFDAWTRRRFGVAAGGLAASLLALAGAIDTDAGKRKRKRRRKRKKRCKPLGAGCKQNGKKRCCKTLACEEGANRCCRKLRAICANEAECCGNLECSAIAGLSGKRCCVAFGSPCTTSDDCCDGRVCNESLDFTCD
jgi:hypothetical protein